ncbi:glycoside hydrolase family 9 protein [Sphingomonas morindae]|uniref:Glycoside hydrolase family 9 protein n=1 Tax=Sphingomonas morindae TaxID=1541170 RepID=A0ABY4XDG6_9SPHN|nr:glycoside hydrolase family 9 protein [Sphingomonas morindae]USI75025.1 glycoside hydrolase family 9 protein [Sphingomonas morindae]
MPLFSSTARAALALALAAAASLASAAPPAPASLTLNDQGYYEAPGVDWLSFNNANEGLFADAKMSGIELIQQDVRTVTNGDVRLAATPGQWDPAGQFVSRTIDKASGAVTTTLAYPDSGFRYMTRTVPQGDTLRVEVVLPEALPAALVGKAGFNLEFLPAAYFHHSYAADDRTGIFPLYPASAMTATATRNAASGRSEGPGAEPLPIAHGHRFVMAPEDPTHRVTVTAEAGEIALYDGRNQAQNGWFVLRAPLPAGRSGTVLRWTLAAQTAPGWRRRPSIAHSQLGYLPGGQKIATVELDRHDPGAGAVKLFRVEADGRFTPVPIGPTQDAGRYLRYRYRRADFSAVRTPGSYVLDYDGVRTAPFRIAADLYADAWTPTLDVYFPIAMDHMRVNEAYRVWHGDSHRDDARQAPVNHEHIDLYAQGPSTDDKYKPGEHIPGLNVGGWFDAGDFDIRTETHHAVLLSMVRTWERARPMRDTTSVDERLRRVEIHVPDGQPDLLEQIRHGTLQLVAQFDAVGHAINGIMEPDVGEYTHLGDAGSKTDGLIYDPALAPGEERDGHSGWPDDRWAFTTKSSALNYGSIATLAAASRALAGFDDQLAARARALAISTWAEEQSHAPDLFHHGNTTGGPLIDEQFGAAVELLRTTGDRRYADQVTALWPQIAPVFFRNVQAVAAALPLMPPAFRATVAPSVRAWKAATDRMIATNPFGVPITTGGWAGNGAVLGYGLDSYALHKAYPELVDSGGVARAIAYLTGHHPGSDISFVSAVGTRSKEVAYGNNRADFTFLAGGVVPGELLVKPDFPENKEDWPFFWGENEYVISEGAHWLELVHDAIDLGDGTTR